MKNYVICFCFTLVEERPQGDLPLLVAVAPGWSKSPELGVDFVSSTRTGPKVVEISVGHFGERNGEGLGENSVIFGKTTHFQ